MSDEEPTIAHSNEIFRMKIRGFDHIPESERNMSLRPVNGLWVGTSVNLFHQRCMSPCSFGIGFARFKAVEQSTTQQGSRTRQARQIESFHIMLNSITRRTYLMFPGDILRYASILSPLGTTRGLRAGRAWNGTN